MVGPDWNHCLEYEFQLRKKALRLVKDQGVSIQRALKYRDHALDGRQLAQSVLEVVALRSQRSFSARTACSETATRLEGQARAGKGRGKGKSDSK